MNLKKPLPVSIAIALVIGGLVAVYGWRALSQAEPGVRLSARTDPVGATPSEEVARAASAESPSVAAAKAESVKAAMALYGAAMTSSNPYAEAIRLRNAKVPGSFAAAMQVAATCRIAYAKEQSMASFPSSLRDVPRGRWIPVPNEGMSPEMQAKRTAASQEVEARCRPFIDDHDMDEPLPDDIWAVAYRERGKRSARSMSPTQKDLADASSMLAEQGLLWQVWGYLAAERGPFGYFDGQPLGGLSADEFSRAMEMGSLLATTPDGGGREDLRTLTGCLYQAQCDGALTELPVGDLPRDSESVAKIKAMAERIAEAMRANQIGRFKGKSGGG